MKEGGEEREKGVGEKMGKGEERTEVGNMGEGKRRRGA